MHCDTWKVILAYRGPTAMIHAFIFSSWKHKVQGIHQDTRTKWENVTFPNV